MTLFLGKIVHYCPQKMTPDDEPQEVAAVVIAHGKSEHVLWASLRQFDDGMGKRIAVRHSISMGERTFHFVEECTAEGRRCNQGGHE